MTTNTIKTADPSIEFPKEEYNEICTKIYKCINNMNELKQIKEQQKEIMTTSKRLRAENKDLMADIINFAESYGLESLNIDNGYILKFVSRKKKQPKDDNIIRSGIIERLKTLDGNITLEKIGYDELVDGIINSIDAKCRENETNVTSIHFNKKKDPSETRKSKKNKK